MKSLIGPNGIPLIITAKNDEALLKGFPSLKSDEQVKKILQKENLTLPEAALFLRMSNRTLYRWLKSGKIAGKKEAGKWIFSRKYLEAFNQPSPPPSVMKKRRRKSDMVNGSKIAERLGLGKNRRKGSE